ncbi:YlbL family protein [Rothia nasimurium]|uniref:YlbL family protein n=1 Tax=Rothia nasimurium TaxID=85336 RepID=UPI001F229D94|nr:S16 family serine protease [Rothia nasimurium]
MLFSRRNETAVQPSRRFDMRRVSAVGTTGLCLLAFIIPVDFVTEAPGPTFNTIGDYNGKPLIEIEGVESFPVSGNLDMTTVSVAGGPNSSMGALQALSAWLGSSTTALPSDLIYDPTLTREAVSAQNSADMTNSQEVAQAAALTQLGIEYGEQLKVSGTVEGGPSAGLISEGEILTALDDTPLKNYAELVDLLNQGKGREVTLTLEKDGITRKVAVTPVHNDELDRYVLGLYLSRSFDFPMQVTYGLEEVGGPSAGMMFALGIMDEITEGEMTGGKHFAGTGTIDSDGRVGGIGGIRQKMYGAQESGATVFLAPTENCNEVVGYIPEGLTVIGVSTLDEAAAAVTAIGQGTDPATLASCPLPEDQ